MEDAHLSFKRTGWALWGAVEPYKRAKGLCLSPSLAVPSGPTPHGFNPHSKMARHTASVALICLSFYLWLLLDTTQAMPQPASVSVNDAASMGIGRTSSSALRARRYPLVLTGRSRPDALMRTRFQIDPDLLLDDDEALVDNKREMDEYGHVRFGKRTSEKVEDYGHLRYGRSSVSGGGDSD